MAWLSLPTSTICFIEAAASQLLSPGCDALISQVPEPRNVTVALLSVQTEPDPCVIEMTGVRPDVAEAVGTYVLSFAVVEGTIEVNESDCDPLATEMVWLLLEAAR